MEVEIGRGKKARRAYGFDEIAIVWGPAARVSIAGAQGPIAAKAAKFLALAKEITTPRLRDGYVN